MRVVQEAHSLYILENPENPVALCLLCNVGRESLGKRACWENSARTVPRPGFCCSYSPSRFLKRSSCPLPGFASNSH